MDASSINIFDIAIIGLVLVFALRSFFGGIIKEISGIAGIVGGVYSASMFANDFGKIINDNMGLKLEESTYYFLGFVLVFVLVWISAIILGRMLSSIVDLSGLGVVNRFLGFLFGGIKVFLILAIIVSALSRIEQTKSTLDEYAKGSMSYEHLISIGNKILNIDTNKIKDALNLDKSMDEFRKNIGDNIDGIVK